MTSTRIYDDAGDNVRVGNLLVQGELVFGGGVSPPSPTSKTPPFLYVAAGSENPAGFIVAFPSGARGGAAYVAVVCTAGVAAGEIAVDVPSALYTDTGITVKTSARLGAGDKLAVIIGDM